MEQKAWYNSITIWAAKGVILLQAIPMVVVWLDSSFGLQLATNPVVTQLLTIIAAILAIYGRVTAKSVIK